jgi:muconolactone D-isomerase
VEFLTDLVTNVPDGTPDSEVEATRAAEKRRAGELAEQGQLLRL